MTIIEIISAILLILSCVFIIAVVLMQESKQGMSNVISGGSSDNYFQKNSGRTKEAKLSRATKIAAVVVFVVAIAVNLISVYNIGGSDTGSTNTDNSISLDDLGLDSDTDTDEDADSVSDDTDTEDTAAQTSAAETTTEPEATTAAE